MIEKPSFSKTTLTPTWSYPLYHRQLQLRPLPVLTEEEGSDGEIGSESDSGSFTFLPAERSSSRPNNKQARKKHSGRRRSSGDEDSDQEPTRKPLSQSIHDYRQAQRLYSHPNMAGGHTRSKAAGKRQSEKNSKEDATEKENAELRLQVARLSKRMKLDAQKTSSTSPVAGTSKAMEREVAKITKTKLWKVCKFFKNDSKVRLYYGWFGSCFVSASSFSCTITPFFPRSPGS